MKNLTILILFLPFWLSAQNISVKSFNQLSTDMDARVNFPVQDQNGDKCAILKIVTSQQGFSFDGDMNGIMKVEYKTGEYWIYIPYGSKRLSIKHKELGVLRGYQYPVPIQEAVVYEMQLVTSLDGKNMEIIQWVSISTQPDSSTVYVDDKYLGKSPLRVAIDTGVHKIKYEKLYYNTVEKEFFVDRKTKYESQVLTGEFIEVKVQSFPKSAEININDSLVGKTNTVLSLNAGEYNLRLNRKGFYPFEQKIVIGEKQSFAYNLKPVEERSKTLAILYSTLWPGAGQSYLNRGGVTWLSGIVVYGLGATSYMQNTSAATAYKNYEASDNTEERNKYYDEAETKNAQSKTLMYTAAGLWFANMVWVCLMPSDSKKYGDIKPTASYNNATNTVSYGLSVNLNK